MLHSLRLYFKLFGSSFKSQMQHRASFFMLAIAHFISTFVDIFGIWVLFARFKVIQGWTLEELALIYGIMHMGFAAAEAIARGFDTFSTLIKQGDFDRLLLRPTGTLFQVATREFQLMRIGRFFQGLAVLLWGCHQLHLPFLSLSSLILSLALIGTTCLFYGLFIIQATLCFWTTETLEIMNITTYGGLESGQYPMSIYHPSFRLFFTFVIPLACVAYYPLAVMLKHEALPLWTGMLLPLAGVAFLGLSCQLWKIGVSRYQSTGN
ncbi:ABC transporter permease [Candidatus Protochlamydia phocaeensis]|uniref:ABC transporter permease n=1 Tax=Candidatus Protochlamydia phocaeensis TaxID=1414722 RepID=UPI000838378D|nr:ABC-2 family transporter protein [Candidatus Protochlamydia phocaeensis]